MLHSTQHDIECKIDDHLSDLDSEASIGKQVKSIVSRLKYEHHKLIPVVQQLRSNNYGCEEKDRTIVVDGNDILRNNRNADTRTRTRARTGDMEVELLQEASNSGPTRRIADLDLLQSALRKHEHAKQRRRRQKPCKRVELPKENPCKKKEYEYDPPVQTQLDCATTSTSTRRDNNTTLGSKISRYARKLVSSSNHHQDNNSDVQYSRGARARRAREINAAVQLQALARGYIYRKCFNLIKFLLHVATIKRDGELKTLREHFFRQWVVFWERRRRLKLRLARFVGNDMLSIIASIAMSLEERTRLRRVGGVLELARAHNRFRLRRKAFLALARLHGQSNISQ